MSKKTGIYVIIGCITPIIIVGAIYFGLAYYYSEGFTYGLWINGIYSTGKSVEVINQELTQDEPNYQLNIIDKSGNSYVIMGEQIEYKSDYRNELNNIMNSQNPLLWGTKLVKHDYRRISADVTYNQQLLDEFLSTQVFMKEDLYNEDNKVEIVLEEDGYHLIDETKELLVKDKAYLLIVDALNEGKREINLKNSLCYEDLPTTREDVKKRELFDKINDFQDFTMTYRMGDSDEIIDASVVSKWILLKDNGDFQLDESGNIILDEESIREYINGLGEKYDTLDETREFKSTRGDIITLEGGTYGNDIDEEKEYNFLLEAFKNDATGQIHEPEYLVKAKNQGSDDIGGTYIEVDMSLQHLYYYENYDVVVDTPVVTGNLRTKCGTPAKVCYVYYKQKNRTLRGANYASFVYYWMAVYKNIGIHDATWRDEFGGEIYKTSGSHGCVNVPKDKAALLYEKVEKGTPVIMFY